MVKRGAASSSPIPDKSDTSATKQRADGTETSRCIPHAVSLDAKEAATVKREESVSPANNEASEKPSTSNPARKTTPKRRRKRKANGRRSAAAGGPSAGDSDTEQLKSRLLKRSEKDEQSRGSKSAKLESERGPVIKRRPNKGAIGDQSDESACVHEIVNPSTYVQLFTRLEETHFNKAVKPDGDCLDNTPWLCCFCLRKPCVDDLGDLFGPYYVKLSPPAFWPPFLENHKEDKSGKKATSAVGESDSSAQPKVEVVADLWVHGDCVYWAPGVLLRGWGMTGLEECLPKYWQQKCASCQQLGASITCAVKGCEQSFHYPCAVLAGAVFKESTLSVYCESHKKLAEKRK